jgi:hypothetical protein
MSREYSYPSLGAGERLHVNKTGRFIRLVEALGGSSGQLVISFPEQTGMSTPFDVPLSPGTWIQLPAGEQFSEFFIYTPQALTDVKLIVTDGIYGDDRLVLSGNVLNINTLGGTLSEIADGAGPVSVSAGSCVSIAPDNFGRQNLFIRNTGSNSIFIRSDNTTAESAIEVAAGQTAFIEVTDEVFAYNPGGAAINVQVSEIG